MEEKEPNHMFSVCTPLRNGYRLAFAQLDQMVKNKARELWAERTALSRGIRIVDWKDEVFPAVNETARESDYQQTIIRVVIYEDL